MKIKIRELCLSIASLGPIGYLPFGGLITALLTFPIIIILGWLYLLSTSFFYGVVTILVALVLTSIFIALRLETDQHPGVIVINHMLGILIVFICIPVKIKFAIIGFLLFYVVKNVLPLLVPKLDRCPFFFTILCFDVASGLVVNMFLHFVLWMTS